MLTRTQHEVKNSTVREILYAILISIHGTLSGIKPPHMTYYGRHDLPITLWIISGYLRKFKPLGPVVRSPFSLNGG